MDQQNPTLVKIPILDTRKFKQWQFRIQQYLQHEHYALWEVIEFGDSYEAPVNVATTGTASDGTGKKKGRTVTLTADDMQKRKNDVKAITTLLLSLPDEHQLQFSKYKISQELWAAILKTSSGNEATKKTKKNLLKQQYGNFKAEGSEMLEHTFNRLQVIVSQLQFMEVEIEQDDLNQKFLTSLAPEWLMHTIVWRNRSDLDTMSLDDLYNHLKNMAFISSAKHNSGNEEVNTTSVSTVSTNVSTASANIGVATISQDTAWKKISIQGIDVAGFDKSKVECFNCHKMGHFARECKAPRSQDRGRRDNYKQWSKVEEQALKALMAIDGVGWDWSYMVNDEENHALIDDEETPTEFTLMAKTSVESEVFDNSLCSKAWLAQVEARLAEHRSQELKYYEKIREKGELETKLTGFQTALKDLDSLLKSQRLDKNKEGLGYSDVPPPPAQIYSPPKKDMSWTDLLEFKDDTVINYSRPSPAIESTSDDAQNKNRFVTKTEASPSTISPKPFIKFMKANDSPTKSKKDKVETAKKPPVKYAEQYRKPTKKPNGEKGTSRLQNNTHKSFTPRPAVHKPYRPPMRPMRSNMNTAQPNKTSFNKPAHSYTKRPFQRTSAVRSQYRAPWGPTVNRNVSNVNRKFPTANRKFPTGSTKFSTADLGKKENAIKASACYWDSGCSRHMTGNISYLSDYEPFNGGYVSFGQGGCKITSKGTIKIECIVLGRNFKLLDDANMLLRTPRQHNIYSIDLNNIVQYKDLTCLVAKAFADKGMLWHRMLGHLNFKTKNREAA
nr:hypothetical protein [Tanacetum cinerariifolium]